MEEEYVNGQPVSGWITMTWTNRSWVMYGPFDSKEKAEVWQNQLTHDSTVEPLYMPFVYNRG